MKISRWQFRIQVQTLFTLFLPVNSLIFENQQEKIGVCVWGGGGLRRAWNSMKVTIKAPS